jgi:protein-disulfide isomerase
MNYQKKNLLKRVSYYILALGVIALVIWGIIASVKSSQLTVPVPLASVVTADDWQKGNPEAAVTLVEYSDFQCPACASFAPLVTQLTSQYGDRVLFVYRHFPLREKHQNTEIAAEAAEAAGLQNKFWEMHNILFATQDTWGTSTDAKSIFQSYATALGLNLDQFITDSNSDNTADQVEADYRSGLAANIDGTPTFFLQGVKIANPNSYDAFVTLIEQALAKTSQSPLITP